MLIYLDLVLILNFLVDFLLLLGANRLAGFPPGWGRCALAACLGCVYAAGCLLPGFHFLGNLLWRFVCLAGMAGIAFGWNQYALRRGAVFVLLSMALGGIAMGAENRNFFALLLCAFGLWLLCRVSFGGSAGNREYVPVRIQYGQQEINLIALRDTGNTLRDPVTGESVLVAGANVAEKLLGLSSEQLTHPVETVATGVVPGLRLIPYRAVGQPGSMMLALRFDHVKVGSTDMQPLIAFAPEEISQGEGYQMLAGGAI